MKSNEYARAEKNVREVRALAGLPKETQARKRVVSESKASK